MTETSNRDDKKVSVGVQELIEKLRHQGVKSGQNEAAQIVAGAQVKASKLIEDAKAEAESIVKSAREEARFIDKSGKEALKMAERNAVLELKDYLLQTFSAQIGALVTGAVAQEETLQKMIIEVAGENHLRNEKNIEVILPRQVRGVDELRENPKLVKQGSLLAFVMGQAATMLKEGVTFSVGDSEKNGIGFRLKDKDVEVELTDEAVTAALLRHLQPRFRALLEGIIK